METTRNDHDLSRYHRQFLYGPIGKEGQKKLLGSRVALLGCGALGSVTANTLARAGVGFLRIVDRDFIELNNLQRQVLFDEEDIRENLPKAVAAERKLRKINSEIEIEARVEDVNYTTVERHIEDVDLVLDGMDNFETRFLINEACVKLAKPWIYGGCIGTHGLTLFIIPGETPCLRCVFEASPPPELTPTCDTAGILSPIVNVIAAFEATEAIKWLSGNRKAVNRNLYEFDIWSREARSLKVNGPSQKKSCPTCGQRNFELLRGEGGSRTTTLCGRNAVQIALSTPSKISFEAMAERLKNVGDVRFNTYLLKLKVDSFEITLFRDGRAIVQGTSDPNQAKSLYSKYISI